MPKGWRSAILADLFTDISAGVSVNGSDRPARDGERGVLTLSAVSGGRFDPCQNKAVAGVELSRISQSVRAGTILVSRSNTIELVGESALVDRDCPSLTLPDLLWECIPADDGRTDAQWLSYVLRSFPVRQEIKKRATGTSGSMKKLSMKAFRKIPAVVPPLGEQRRIAEILGAWDEAIEKVQALIQAKQKLKRALMHQLLTPTRRFPQFKGKWRQVHLGDVFEERVERGHTGLKLLAVTGSDGVVDREDLVRRDTSAEDKSAYLRVCPGDIAYNTMRMWQGVFGLSLLEGIVSPAYTIVTPTNDVDGAFAAYLFKLPRMIHQFWRYSQGLVSDTLNLKFPNFAQIKVQIPEKPEQVAIAGTLAAADAKIQALERNQLALTTQKRGLMQKLLTGQIRVREGGLP